MTVYLSGPIAGNDDYVADFAAAAELVRKHGDCPVSPVTMPRRRIPFPATEASMLLMDLAALIRCRGIFFLPGAEDSRGSRIERLFAEYAGIQEIRYAEEAET